MSQAMSQTQIAKRISAIICTHNRDRYLGLAIDSLLAQTLAPEQFEIIVIDNASTDTTRSVVEARQSTHPGRVRYIYESTLGLSTARNTGAQSAVAPILAYLDDDAVASSDWLTELLTAYEQDDRLAIAGGKVTLIWTDGITSPNWLSGELAGNLGAYDLGDRDRSITVPGQTPRGLNYSIRQTFLQEVGGFDPNLGRVGTNLLSNEELHMTALALAHQWNVAYLPKALVAHHVAPERVNRAWFLQRGWWQGVSECYREEIAGESGWGQFPRGAERLLRGLYKSAKFVRQPATCFENLVYTYGQLAYLQKAVQSLFTAKSV
jgi:glycosyltransferase involved in cell wall biosynthesis